MIEAVAQDFKPVRLLRFSKPLTAGQPKNDPDHGKGLEQWTFSLPTAELYEIGLKITNLSDCPDATPMEIVILSSATDSYKEIGLSPLSGVEITTKQCSTSSGESLISIRTKLSIEELQGHLLIFDFIRRSNPETPWEPLQCRESFGYSELRLVFFGRSLDDNESTSWWRYLWCGGRPGDDTPNSGELVEALKGIELSQLKCALETCHSLLKWKYPTNVWNSNAIRFQDFGVHLGRHRFKIGDGSEAIWWRAGASEISRTTAKAQTAIIRQLMFGSQPNCLRTPPECLEFGEGPEFETPVGRSLNLASFIRQSSDFVTFVQQEYHNHRIEQTAFQRFSGFPAAQMFGSFDFRTFLEKLEKKAEELDANCPRISATTLTLLSAEHLLLAVRDLKRRCQILDQASKTDSQHPLGSAAQSIEDMDKNLFRVTPLIHSRLKISGQFYDRDSNSHHYWVPPCLPTKWERKVAAELWCLVAAARLAANGVVSPAQFKRWRREILQAPDERTTQNRICILLSFAPELFGFYVALFDLAFAEFHQDKY